MSGDYGKYRSFQHDIPFSDLAWPDANTVRDRCELIAGTDFIQAIGDIASSLGFDFFSFAYGNTDSAPSGDQPQARMVSNYPEEWCALYASVGHAASDPIVQYAKRASLPFAWGRLDRLSDLPDTTRELLRQSWDFDIFNGVSIPVHGPNGQFMLFSMVTKKGADVLTDLIRENFTFLKMITPFVVDAAVGKFIEQPEALNVELTDQERTCLYWTAQGKTSWEIAQILGRSKAAVEYHLQKSMRKLNAFTKAQAAAITLRHGLL